MQATEDLRSEHKAVIRMLDIMDGMAADLRVGRVVRREEFDQVMEFLGVFVDQCHHGKEEQLLFPAMRELRQEDVDTWLEQLAEEHALGRGSVARQKHQYERFERREPNSGIDLMDEIAAYTDLLRAHILTEEGDVFGTADTRLSAEVQEMLVEGYDRIEREVIGEGRHEAFHAMLDRLEQMYGFVKAPMP